MRRMERMLEQRTRTNCQANPGPPAPQAWNRSTRRRAEIGRGRGGLLGREAASMPIQKRLLGLRLERSGARPEGPNPEQFSALSSSASASLRANQFSEQ